MRWNPFWSSILNFKHQRFQEIFTKYLYYYDERDFFTILWPSEKIWTLQECYFRNHWYPLCAPTVENCLWESNSGCLVIALPFFEVWQQNESILIHLSSICALLGGEDKKYKQIPLVPPSMFWAWLVITNTYWNTLR